MRIASYNIHAGSDGQNQPSIPQIAQTLRNSKADIYLLQEVDRFLPRSGFRDQAAVLAAQIETAYCQFYGRLRLGKAGFGNAILSHMPITETFRVALPSAGGEPRAAIGVLLKNGITVWNTHLGLHHDWRKTQLRGLAAHINRAKGPVIVGGDFNATIDAEEVQDFLCETGLQAISTPDLTFPSALPTHRIDFLLARGGKVSHCAGTIADPGSDHCLIWADWAEGPEQQAQSAGA